MAKTRPDKNSVTAQLAGFKGAMEIVPLPQGCELTTDFQQIMYNVITRTRAREEWRDLDLVSVHQMVILLSNIREARLTLDMEGITIENQRGTMVPNPLISIIDTWTRTYLAFQTKMSLNQVGADPRTINASGKVQENARSAGNDMGDDDLIAKPK